MQLSGHGGAGLMVGLGDLSGLFPPAAMVDAVHLPPHVNPMGYWEEEVLSNLIESWSGLGWKGP